MLNITNKKIVVYSCVTGKYEKLINHKNLEKKIKYIFFTDSSENVPHGWIMQPINGLDNFSNKDKNRYVKFHPSEFLPSHDISIYLDGNIEIINHISDLVDKIYLKDEDIFLFRHFERESIYDEGKKCIEDSLDWFWRIRKQMKRYSKELYPEDRGLFENNIIICKNNENSRKLLHNCWKEYSKEAKRDQLALNYCSWKLKIPIYDLGESNVRSGGEFFFLDLNNRYRKITFIHLIRLVLNSIYLFTNKLIDNFR
tara:strand:+ start:3503 stop:4267 length:765 start_codon:yes stop_codon:yes gene_type:complete